MALVKCPECGREGVSDTATSCPGCGFNIKEYYEKNKIVEDEITEEESADETNTASCEGKDDVKSSNDVEGKHEKKPLDPKKKKIIVAIILVIIIGGIGIYAANYKSIQYNKAQKLYENEEYGKAEKIYSKISGYKHSDRKAKECKHLDAVQHDKEAPTITGIDSGSQVSVDFGADFNLNEYLSSTIKISDNVSDNISTYNIETQEKIYSGDGKIDTMFPGDYDVKVTAKDEAGNEGTLKFRLTINPLRITPENPTPVVYDGQYGKVQITSVRYGTEAGTTGYHITFHIENRSGGDLGAWLYNAAVNGNQITTYHDISIIGADLSGDMDSNIYEEDLAVAGTYSEISSSVGIGADAWGGQDYESIPIIIETRTVGR